MRSLRLRLRPGDVTIDPVVDVYLDAPFVDGVGLHHWNLQGDDATFMLTAEGDPDRFREALAAVDLVRDLEVLPVGERSCYAYMLARPTDLAWRLFDAFTATGLLAVPPVRFADGEIAMTVLGDQVTLQETLEGIPEAIDVEIERLGEFSGGPASPRDVLTERQREAVEAGLDLGYYEVPREASHEDVAETMGCAPSTAAEHLRKAEARILRAVLG